MKSHIHGVPKASKVKIIFRQKMASLKIFLHQLAYRLRNILRKNSSEKYSPWGKKLSFSIFHVPISYLKKVIQPRGHVRFFSVSLVILHGHIDAHINLGLYSIIFLFQGSNYIFQRWFFKFFMEIKVKEKSKMM